MWWDNYWGMMPLTKGMSRRKLAQRKNGVEFRNQFERAYQLAMNRYKWRLPDTCDERMVERSLVLYAQAAFARRDGALLSLATNGGEDVSLYGYPTKIWAYGYNGETRSYRAYVPGADDSSVLRKTATGVNVSLEPEAVVCYDNLNVYPTINYIYEVAERMSNLMRACDVAVENLKTPYLITCAETDVKSVNAALAARQENVTAVITAKGFATDLFKVWPTTASDQTLDAFWAMALNVWGEYLELIGYQSNPNEDKRERLLTAEIKANNQVTNAALLQGLALRRRACEQVKEALGFDIGVEINKEVFGDVEAAVEDARGTGKDNPNGDPD